MSRATLAALAGVQTPRSFYDGTEGRTLTSCRDCGQRADVAMGGDHGGQCIADVTVALPGSALAVIRQLALDQTVIGVKQLADAMVAAGASSDSAAAAVQSASDRGWIAEHVRGRSIRSKITGQRPLRDRAGR